MNEKVVMKRLVIGVFMFMVGVSFAEQVQSLFFDAAYFIGAGIGEINEPTVGQS